MKGKKLKLWKKNSKTQTMTKFKNSICNNLKTKIVTKLQNSNYDKIQKLKLWPDSKFNLLIKFTSKEWLNIELGYESIE